jgi:hypothetical protein
MTNLPVVTIETIREVGEDAMQGSDKLFMQMAAANPELYRFVYEMHQQESTTKTMMLGLLVAMYHSLDRQIEKGKRSKKRLRHNV